jgi:2-polyprenyl-3-methyl-5-hydroxy-6-metoxy-1,4-benzoquinol methylase
MRVEHVSCGVCGGTRSLRIGWRGRFRTSVFTRVCRRCGLVYESPRLSERETRRYYESSYQADYAGSRQLPAAPALEARWAETARERLSVLCRVVPDLTGRRVLEVGSASGAFLLAVQTAGGAASGIEPAEAYATHCVKVLGLDVRPARFEDIDVDALAGRFDVVAMFHVLEHTGDPIDTLKRCRRLVSADGVVFVEVPNWRSTRRYRQPIIRFLRPVHLFNFSPRSLAIVAAAAGLEVVGRDERVPTRIRWVLRPAAPAPAGDLPHDNPWVVAAHFYLWTLITRVRGVQALVRHRLMGM